MNAATARIFFLAAIMTALSFGLRAAAPDPATKAEVEQPDTPAAAGSEQVELETPRTAGSEDRQAEARSAAWGRDSDRMIVHFGKDAHLPAGEHATAVVSIVGSATSDGEVREGVISIVGNTRVNGPGHDAVAVFGDTYVNSRLRGDAVAVFGNVELGPDAEIDGDVVAVGGVITRAAPATVHGDAQEISLPVDFGHLEWLRPWLRQCLLFGRPLALEPGLGWAWTLAFGFLGLYVLIALLFSGTVEKCVATLESHPGHAIVASLLTMLLSPVLMVLLGITIIGLALIPFLWTALFCAGLFGKVVVLAALGRRLTRFIGAGPLSHIAFPVLLGGLILIGVYLVPVLGFVAYKLTGIVGLGVVVYTSILAMKAYREEGARPVADAAYATASAVEPAGTVENALRNADLQASTEPQASASAATIATAALPRAGFAIRMAALLIDGLLIAIALSALQDSDEAWLLALALYGAVMWKLKGTTVGGILCNLQVVRVDGREIDWATAIVRALSCFLSLAAAGLGFLWIVFDTNRQAWHDKIAGTVVVRTPKGISLV